MKRSLLLFLLGVSPAFSQVKACRWGLVPNTDCPALEKEAAERIVTAKTTCQSRDSIVTWPKTFDNPHTQAAFREIESAYNTATLGYESLPSCRRANLIFKFTVDKGSYVELDVIEAESGDNVFQERRYIADEDADLHRIGKHFLLARMAAKVISATYHAADENGCTQQELAQTLGAYTDEQLVGKHFSCRDTTGAK